MLYRIVQPHAGGCYIYIYATTQSNTGTEIQKCCEKFVFSFMPGDCSTKIHKIKSTNPEFFGELLFSSMSGDCYARWIFFFLVTTLLAPKHIWPLQFSIFFEVFFCIVHCLLHFSILSAPQHICPQQFSLKYFSALCITFFPPCYRCAYLSATICNTVHCISLHFALHFLPCYNLV